MNYTIEKMYRHEKSTLQKHNIFNKALFIVSILKNLKNGEIKLD